MLHMLHRRLTVGRRDCPVLLYDERPMQHVHTAGETEGARFIGGELQGCAAEGRQGLANLEVWEGDPRGTIAGLLAIEYQPQRHPLSDSDDIRRVAAFDRYPYLLDAAGHLSFFCLSGSEEEPGQECYCRQSTYGDSDIEPCQIVTSNRSLRRSTRDRPSPVQTCSGSLDAMGPSATRRFPRRLLHPATCPLSRFGKNQSRAAGD